MAKIKAVLKRSARIFELALLIGLVLIGPIMGFSYYSLIHLNEARKVQEHSLVVREHLNDLRAAVRQYEILYLREAPEDSKGESRHEIDSILNSLSESVEADEIQTESLTEVRAAISEFVTEPTPETSREVREWILSMDAQEAEYLNEHRPAAVAFLSTASGAILLVGILSLFLSILAFMGLRRQMRSREILETELRAAERQATRASEMKSKFLATISHEIRTPLNGIIAMADVLRGTAATEKEKGMSDVIFQSGQSLLRIINDLLNFSQIESGQVGLKTKTFSLKKMVEQTCSVLELKAQHKSLSLNLRYDTGIPEKLEGDDGRLEQVLYNLIGNAIKFTSTGRIDVRVERDPASDQDVARVNFSIVDTGQGVAPGDLEVLFQPFNRLGQVGTSGEPGTGLGLSIAQSLVRQMGGEIRVESRVGHGSTFWFQLPMRIPKSSIAIETQQTQAVMQAALHAPSVASKDESVAQFSGMHIVVVEDNETNQIVAQTVLEQLGCQVQLASTGQGALDLLKDGRSRDEVDAVLMDCQMPILDGYETTRRLRAEENAKGLTPIWIVAMTANAQADDRARCLAAGMDDYIAKPFVIEDLVRALKERDLGAEAISVERALASLKSRLGEKAHDRIRRVFAMSLDEWKNERLANDPIRLREVAHKLKSSARTIGADAFAKRLETFELSADLPNAALLSEIDRDMRGLKRLLR